MPGHYGHSSGGKKKGRKSKSMWMEGMKGKVKKVKKRKR